MEDHLLAHVMGLPISSNLPQGASARIWSSHSGCLLCDAREGKDRLTTRSPSAPRDGPQQTKMGFFSTARIDFRYLDEVCEPTIAYRVCYRTKFRERINRSVTS